MSLPHECSPPDIPAYHYFGSRGTIRYSRKRSSSSVHPDVSVLYVRHQKSYGIPELLSIPRRRLLFSLLLSYVQ